MKVLSIQAKQTQRDNRPYWKVILEGTIHPLILWDMPKLFEGDYIADDDLILSGDGQTYSMKTDSRTDQATEKDAAIREQTAMKIIADLFVADKIPELSDSKSFYVIRLREWLHAALIHGPITSSQIEGKIHPVNEE